MSLTLVDVDLDMYGFNLFNNQQINIIMAKVRGSELEPIQARLGPVVYSYFSGYVNQIEAGALHPTHCLVM
ncbi:hypothetical protein HZY62_18855 [Maribacter polysiphoniae]|uniref:Uncharacterized protein n=1 Tax=Maribacter polysiphoniae TaxID=429344 RepID=A0ABR7W3A5_9FLAO|nr:hypothetical protein [Maribacter polysiphoniae]MBD1262664.1 hypothetical protein [Maribacter polysiphoniae]